MASVCAILSGQIIVGKVYSNSTLVYHVFIIVYFNDYSF